MLLELNIKTQKDLDKYLEVLSLGQCSGVSITSKKGNMDLNLVLSSLLNCPYLGAGSNADWGNTIVFTNQQYDEQIKIIPTFSCSVNYDQNAIETFIKFIQFTQTLKQYNINQILLVSGNPKMKLDTLEVLKQFKDSDFKIAVAYNPYSKNIEIENKRLMQKLSHPNVNQVWLQLGQDFEKLKVATKFIRDTKPQIQIVNSILQSTKSLLKSLQFHPWSGVYYTDEFYNDLDFALQNVQEMKQLSQDLGLEILISGV
jgi:5,10-methylenetetrahydrofolate reductase